MATCEWEDYASTSTESYPAKEQAWQVSQYTQSD
jgi:hypothetical protein